MMKYAIEELKVNRFTAKISFENHHSIHLFLKKLNFEVHNFTNHHN